MFANSRVVATLPASDLDRAMAWYSEKLGLAPITVIEGEGAFYEVGGTRFALYPSPAAGQNPATAAAFVVENFDAAAQRLRDTGVSFEEFDLGAEKMVDGVLTRSSGAKAAWFKDCEGNTLALSNRRI